MPGSWLFAPVLARQRPPPVFGRDPQIVDDLIVVGLERMDHLEYQRYVGRAGCPDGAQHPAGLDPAGLIGRRRERPVMVGAGVGLLQLDDWGTRAELLQPGVRISLVAAGSWHALMPDVQARDDRHPPLVAGGQQRAQCGDRGGLSRPGPVLDPPTATAAATPSRTHPTPGPPLLTPR